MLTTYLTGISFVFLLALSIKCISIVVKQIPPFVIAQLEVIIAILLDRELTFVLSSNT